MGKGTGRLLRSRKGSRDQLYALSTEEIRICPILVLRSLSQLGIKQCKEQCKEQVCDRRTFTFQVRRVDYPQTVCPKFVYGRLYSHGISEHSEKDIIREADSRGIEHRPVYLIFPEGKDDPLAEELLAQGEARFYQHE